MTTGFVIHSIHDYQRPQFVKGQEYVMDIQRYCDKFSKRKRKISQSSKNSVRIWEQDSILFIWNLKCFEGRERGYYKHTYFSLMWYSIRNNKFPYLYITLLVPSIHIHSHYTLSLPRNFPVHCHNWPWPVESPHIPNVRSHFPSTSLSLFKSFSPIPSNCQCFVKL